MAQCACLSCTVHISSVGAAHRCSYITATKKAWLYGMQRSCDISDKTICKHHCILSGQCSNAQPGKGNTYISNATRRLGCNKQTLLQALQFVHRDGLCFRLCNLCTETDFASGFAICAQRQTRKHKVWLMSAGCTCTTMLEYDRQQSVRNSPDNPANSTLIL